MEDSDVRGLIGAVGKALALQPHAEGVVGTLEDIESQDALREFLESSDLGISDPSRTQFIERVTGERWRDYRSQLAASVNQSYHEFRDPSA